MKTVIINLPSCHYKPFFCGKQKAFWKMYLCILFIYKKGSKVALVHTWTSQFHRRTPVKVWVWIKVYIQLDKLALQVKYDALHISPATWLQEQGNTVYETEPGSKKESKIITYDFEKSIPTVVAPSHTKLNVKSFMIYNIRQLWLPHACSSMTFTDLNEVTWNYTSRQN